MKHLFSNEALRDELKHVLNFTFIEEDCDGRLQFMTQLVGHFWICVELDDADEGYRASIVINEDGDKQPDPESMIEIFNFNSATAAGAFGGCSRFSSKYFESIQKRRNLAEKSAHQAEAYMVKFGGISGKQRALIRHCCEQLDVSFKGTNREDADMFLDKYAHRLKR